MGLRLQRGHFGGIVEDVSARFPHDLGVAVRLVSGLFSAPFVDPLWLVKSAPHLVL